MNDTEFNQLADQALNTIEEMVDDSGADMDYETHGNVMTLEMDNRSQIIINKQEPMHEIWLASKSGGYHFSYQNEQWICSRSGRELLALVREECDKQSDEDIEWT
ncbi:iron donor protein CyaY [Vibrio albus]|jgi:CyaY protein|uniref:Iron-sulfur cluster assembly protein CyaY n=1 Tax=Vibrio albus TaxID=2200953 RepID=A0A2U3B532_9VIBR|nr:iron donor protein CyaY [Vibrio albus]PWI31887.1 iron donor protein CyaY [Vibrio albus]